MHDRRFIFSNEVTIQVKYGFYYIFPIPNVIYDSLTTYIYNNIIWFKS